MWCFSVDQISSIMPTESEQNEVKEWLKTEEMEKYLSDFMRVQFRIKDIQLFRNESEVEDFVQSDWGISAFLDKRKITFMMNELREESENKKKKRNRKEYEEGSMKKEMEGESDSFDEPQTKRIKTENVCDD